MQEGIADVDGVAEQILGIDAAGGGAHAKKRRPALKRSPARREPSRRRRSSFRVGRFQIDLAQSESLATLMDKAIAVNNQWKARLRQAIASGQSEVSVEVAGRDDRCALGKWLHGDNPLRSTGRAGWQRMHDSADARPEWLGASLTVGRRRSGERLSVIH